MRKTQETPASEEAFVEAAETPRPRRSKKLHIPFTGNGLDWSGMNEDQRVDALTAMAQDEGVKATYEALKADIAPPMIQDKHIGWFLDIIEAAEQFIVPRMVAHKTKNNEQGPFVISPTVAKKAFHFDDEKRKELIPPGVEAANAHLPEKVKILISKVGSGTEFVGKLLMAIRDQQMVCVEMQIQENIANGKPGYGTPAPTPGPVRRPVTSRFTQRPQTPTPISQPTPEVPAAAVAEAPIA